MERRRLASHNLLFILILLSLCRCGFVLRGKNGPNVGDGTTARVSTRLPVRPRQPLPVVNVPPVAPGIASYRGGGG